jgi:hypothetical protein
MVKIILVSHSLSLSGAPKVLIDLANFLLKNKYDVTVVCVNSQSKMNRESELRGGKVINMPSPYLRSIFVVKLINYFLRIFINKRIGLRNLWFGNVLKKENPDIIIFNTFYNVDLQYTANILKVPSIRYLHENINYLKTLHSHQINTINEGNYIIGCSPSVVDDAKSIGLHINNTYLPAVTDDLFLSDFLLGKNAPKNNKKILTVGSDEARKGIKYAMALARELPKYQYSWYGEVSSKISTTELVLKGLLPNVPYYDYGYYFLTSVEEPWSIAALEALSNGLLIFGWEHLYIIRALEAQKLAVSVRSFDTDDLLLKFQAMKHKQVNRNDVKKFLEQFSSQNTYGKTLINMMDTITNG